MVDNDQKDSKSPAPKDWKNPPKLSDLQNDLISAKSDHDAQCAKIQRWLDNLNMEGSAKLKTPKGNSSVQPKLIRKQAEWRYAALSEPFLNTDDIFTVSPVTWEDQKAAEQNQVLLNNQFNTKINKIKFIDDYVRDAVNKGVAIVRTGWHFQEEEIKGIRPVWEFRPNPEMGPVHEEIHQLMATNPTAYRFDVPEELQQAHEMTMQTGMPLEPIQIGEEEYTEMKTIKNCPTLDLCDFNNVTLDPSCDGDIDKAGFVIYTFETSMSELKASGLYTNLDDVKENNSSSPLADPDHTSDEETAFQFKDKARKRVVAKEYWGFWDYMDTGVAEPFVATWVDDTLIRMDVTPFPDKKLPFVFVPFMPDEGSLYGEPDGALLEENQKVIGAVTRGMIDLMGKSANGQTGTRKDALDATNRRKYANGQDYEYNAHIDPRMAFYMHTYPEIPSSAPFMLNQQTMEAESMTGVKSFSQGISGNSLGEVAAGVRGALDAASKRETGILRRLAKGVTDIGRKIISMNAEFLEEEEVVRITNNEFVPIRRDDLAGNFDLRLLISTAEEDAAKIEKLAFTLQTMGPKMDFEASKIVMVHIAKRQRMPELANQLETFKPEPDPFEEQMKQLELQKVQAEIAEIVSRTQENYAEAQLDGAKAEETMSKARLMGSQTDKSDLDFLEQESGVTQERELQKQGEQARGNLELAKYKNATPAGGNSY